MAELTKSQLIEARATLLVQDSAKYAGTIGGLASVILNLENFLAVVDDTTVAVTVEATGTRCR